MVKLRLTRDNLKWLLVSFVFVSLSAFFSYYIFPSQASILAISFVVIALTPYLYSMMDKEEAIVARGKSPFLQRYGGILTTLALISIGLFLSFSFWYNVLPSDPAFETRCSTGMPCREGLFHLQTQFAEEPRSLEVIMGLMLLSFALSLFLGAGAILIVTWDLSSLVVRSALGPMGLLVYIPQLLAFFLTGLAGALLSFAIVRHEWRSHNFFTVLKDSAKLLVLSLALVLIYPFLFYII